MTSLPRGLSELADQYDVLLCDVWGVIHNGRESFPAALDALVRWKAGRGPVVLISNAPRPSLAIHSQLDHFKVPREAWTAFVTSGDATRALLAERAPGPCWSIGPARDAPLYDGLGLAFADADDAAFVCVTGPYDDTVETPEDYRGRFEVAVERGLEMICANPDRVVQRGDTLIYCGGALADLYEDMGGRVLMAGKPYEPIYDLALHEAGDVDPARVLAIGDGVITDVKGAADHNLDCLFIARGIHGEAAMRDGKLDAALVEKLLAEEDVCAKYAMSDLVW
jgi:HAD superfamily hydrolase (TIGR01459 family)